MVMLGCVRNELLHVTHTGEMSIISRRIISNISDSGTGFQMRIDLSDKYILSLQVFFKGQ